MHINRFGCTFLFHSQFKFFSIYLIVSADIQRLQKQQSIILIVLIVLLILFVGIHGFQCIRWLRRKDHLSFECLKRFRSGPRREKQQPAPQSDFTHANPHTQSPQQMRKNNGARSVFSISGRAIFFYFEFHCVQCSS